MATERFIRLYGSKNGNTTSIALNGNTMTQKSLTALFVEKVIFLSVINPLYFIEK